MLLRPKIIVCLGRTAAMHIVRPDIRITREEIALFCPWLQREMGIVAPKWIVSLGNVPLRALTGKPLAIGSVHGQVLESELGAPLFALYHPASVLYNPKLRETYARDLEALREEMHFRRLI